MMPTSVYARSMWGAWGRDRDGEKCEESIPLLDAESMAFSRLTFVFRGDLRTE